MANNERRVIIEEKVVKPSMVVPTLFVGLGGAGCRVVARVAKQLSRRVDYAERYEGLTQFAFVDTNINDLEEHRELAKDGLFLISDFDKAEYAELAGGKSYIEPDDYFTQWAFPNYRFRSGDTAGAGQIRVESRLGAHYQLKNSTMALRFRALFDKLKEQQHGHRRIDSNEIRIVLCFSVAGGTGSGAFLTFAYALREIALQLGSPRVHGVAILPSVFEDRTRSNWDGTFANGYAALKEVEHFMKLGAPDSRFFPRGGVRDFHFYPLDRSKRSVSHRPFEFLYLIDRPETFSIPDVCEAAGDGLYLQFYSDIFKAQAGDYDNYTQWQRFLLPNDFEAKGIEGYSSYYGSFGSAVLHVPAPDIAEYCSRCVALNIFSEAFVRRIPSGIAYNPVRNKGDAFFEVAVERDERGQLTGQTVRESEFERAPASRRALYADALFIKRVRMLAAAELQARSLQMPFATVFRHGAMRARPQAYGAEGGGSSVFEVPLDDGGVWFQSLGGDGAVQQLDAFESVELRKGIAGSIAQVVFEALLPPPSDGAASRLASDDSQAWVNCGLMKAARDAAEAVKVSPACAMPNQFQKNDTTAPVLTNLAKGRRQMLLSAFVEQLEEGLGRVGSDGVVGWNLLDNEASGRTILDHPDAAGVSLLARRYAALRIVQELIAAGYAEGVVDNVPAPEVTAAPKEKNAGDRKIDSDDAPGEWTRAIDEVLESVILEGQKIHRQRAGRFIGKVRKWAALYGRLEDAFQRVALEEERGLQRMLEKGGPVAGRYGLDSEALQIESGSRLWNFYFEDKVAGRDDLRLDGVLGKNVLLPRLDELRRKPEGTSSTEDALEIFGTLVSEARRVVGPSLVGDPHATDPEKRAGLTLESALWLEVEYRDLYLSNQEEIKREGTNEVRRLLSQIGTPSQPRILSAKDGTDKHRDYLRDKVRRLIEERSNLLCHIEDKHLNQGGMRPANMFYVAMNKEQNPTVHDALLNSGARAQPVEILSTGWHNLQEAVFYRAILNVPLYVFGRLDRMRSCYLSIKDQGRRAKVLHTDRNWEDTLPDLNPAVAELAHRKKTVRDRIIDFVTLFLCNDLGIARNPGEGTFVRRIDDHYELRGGVPSADGVDRPVHLGETLLEAVTNLPEKLGEESVRFQPYLETLAAVRAGGAPLVIDAIRNLPSLWLRTSQELQTRFAGRLEYEHKRRIEDYRDASALLVEALDQLRAQLEDDAFGRSAGDDTGEAVPDGLVPSETLRQSIDILVHFAQSRIAHGAGAGGARPTALASLFRPLRNDELDKALHRSSVKGAVVVRNQS